MSLLLDALRKSEAQRRRGQLPSLELGSVPERAAPESRRRRWPWLLLLAAVIALGAWQWPEIQRLAESGAPETPVPSAETGPVRNQSPVRVEPTPPPAAVDPAPERPAPAQTQPVDPVESRPVAAQPAEPQQPQQAQQAQPAAEPAPEPSAEPPSEPAREPAPQAAPEPEPSRPDPSPSTAADGADSDSRSDGAIRPWELPQDLRAEFPELELTVHYFAVEPRERFVLINGQRYRQGQRIDRGVRVHEILRRGVVIEFGRYLVLLE